MNLRLRASAAVLGVVLVASSASACGGGSSKTKGEAAPKDASRSDFCAAVASFYRGVATEDGTQPVDLQHNVAIGKQSARELEEVGTPSDIPANARAGFESSLDLIESIPDDATSIADLNVKDDMKQPGLRDRMALFTYETKECPTQMADIGGSN